VNKGGQERIQEAKSCHPNSNAVHGQRAYEILHDDSTAASRETQSLD